MKEKETDEQNNNFKNINNIENDIKNDEDIEKKDILILKRNKQKKEEIKNENEEEDEEEEEIEKVGPSMKKCKKNKKEDIELQIAIENAEEIREGFGEEKKNKKLAKLKKKEGELKNKNLIYLIDEDNFNCVDCGSEKASYISINNGVTLCESCSQEHSLLGHSISYIKKINDQLDEYLFNFIVFGSNTKFKRFVSNENLNIKLSIKKKYKTKGLYFYRKMLKNKIKGLPQPIKDYEDPNELVENNFNDDYPEFNKYKITKRIISKGKLKGESKFLHFLNKLMKLGGNNIINSKKVFLRARTSINNLNTGNISDDNEIKENSNNHSKSHTRKSNRNNNGNLFPKMRETSRPLNIPQKTEKEKEVENEEIRHSPYQTSEVINGNVKV